MYSVPFGLGCLLFFAVAQAVRDAFFGNVFQSVSFFVVAILAFGASTVVFGTWAWHRGPEEVRALIGNTKLFLALNATTAAAWMAYFFALKRIEPAIVSTLYTGIGPIAVLALSALGVSMAKGTATGGLERVGYIGVIACASRVRLSLALSLLCASARLPAPCVGGQRHGGRKSRAR